MLKNKKFLIISLLTAFILVFSFSSCFAATLNSSYTFNVDSENSSIVELKELCEADERVISGNYYYFVGYNTGDDCYDAYLVSKDSSFLDKPYISCSDWSKNGYYQSVLVLLDSSGDIIRISGRNGINSSYTGVFIDVYSSDSSYTIPFATNYPSTYYISTDEGLISFFQMAPQGITQTLVEELTKAKPMEEMKTIVLGYLKYLIALVISVIAFWKGWQFLSMQLRKA